MARVATGTILSKYQMWLKLRSSLKPPRLLLVCMGNSNNSWLVKGFTDYLHPHRQSSFGEATGYGYGWKASKIERGREARPPDIADGIEAFEGTGRLGHGWRYQHIYLLHHFGAFPNDQFAHPLGLDIVAGTE